MHDDFSHAMALHRQGRLTEAGRIYEEILRRDPRHFGALHLSGVMAWQSGQHARAVELIGRAIDEDATVANAHNNLGNALVGLRRLEDALASYERAIALQADHAGAHGNRAAVLNELNRPAEALAGCEVAIRLKPDFADAHNSRGNALLALNRPDEALASYDKALALQPGLADAHSNRAAALLHLGRAEQALAGCDKAIALKPDLAHAYHNRGNALRDLKRFDAALTDYEKALALDPRGAEPWLGRGNTLADMGRPEAAVAAYTKALELNPALAKAWVGVGNGRKVLGRHEEAVAAYDKALALDSDLADAWNGRANVFYDLKHYDEALLSYGRAVAAKPDLAEAWGGRGNVFAVLKRYDEALAAFDKALALKPDLRDVEGARLHARTHLCDWRNHDAERAHLLSSVNNGLPAAPPFVFLAVSSSAQEQLGCAERFAKERFPVSPEPVAQGQQYAHKKIRIAYLSADFREHPMPHLLAGLFELHDRSRFETCGISFAPGDGSAMRTRLEGAFDRFIDVDKYGDDDIATSLRRLEIDIAVDLMGYTANSRTGIMARRAAPIQVSYVGYPGTMAAEYIDYLIADATVIPEDQRTFYTEKVVYLPNTYLATDARRTISEKTFTRAGLGLPEDGFVFCCFNATYKITPDVFGRWMRILKRAPKSVLWLLAGNDQATSNLRMEADARGVDPARLVFAGRIPAPEHLARHRAADLFLDTLPYNAHTTACDALWAGLPVLTQTGEAFASRVAASLLATIDLPELITASPAAYEDLAVEFAANPERLAAIKRKLARNRLTTPLFDTKRFTRHIEAAYVAMHARHQAGLPPDDIHVPQ